MKIRITQDSIVFVTEDPADAVRSGMMFSIFPDAKVWENNNGQLETEVPVEDLLQHIAPLPLKQ